MTNPAATAYATVSGEMPEESIVSFQEGAWAITLPSRADLVALTFPRADRPAWLNQIATRSYAANGDGTGGALYRRATGTVEHGLTETDAATAGNHTQSTWEMIRGGPMARGAVGDGVTDDKAILDLFEDPDFVMGAAGQPPIDLEGRVYEYAGTWNPSKRYVNGTVIDDNITRRHGNGLLTIRTITGNATIQIADQFDTGYRGNSGSGIALNLVLDATAALRLGCVIPVMNRGAGAVTITAPAGVTLNGTDAGTLAIAQNAARALIKVAADAWEAY